MKASPLFGLLADVVVEIEGARRQAENLGSVFTFGQCFLCSLRNNSMCTMLSAHHSNRQVIGLI